MVYHDAVLLNESVEALKIKAEGIYIDATYGGGGHSKEILKKLNKGKLIAFDQDSDAAVNKADNAKLILIAANFSHMKSKLAELNISSVDGILADLGISSHQIDVPERGFSTRFNSALDMRMDQSNSFTASDIVNEYSEQELVRIFSSYGEIRNSKQLAASIVKARMAAPLHTTFELKEAIRHCIPFRKEHQYLAQVFQSLRIEVNNEMEALRSLLEQSADLIAEGGRLVVISYHSLEDRMVKNMVNTGNVDGLEQKDIYGNNTGIRFRAVTKKPVTASAEEIDRNPRSRSARLRIAEKI